MSERPKQTFLAEIAREELRGKDQLFVFWTGILWSPDSRDALIELSRFLRSGRRFDAEERLIQKLPHDFAAKVVWGSRYPHHDATSAWDAMAQLRSANVPETLIARMMGQNAANQFDVEPIHQTAA